MVDAKPQSLAVDAKSRLPAPPSHALMMRLSGWGANVHSDSVVVAPEAPAQVFSQIDAHGCVARGLGRSYGDAALNDRRRIIDMCGLDRLLDFDPDTGVLTCEAGVSLAEILRVFTPRGWFPMVTPGTKFVTVGGCIANDIHGKAHHSQGCFSRCVQGFTLLLPSGEVVAVDRQNQPDLFWCTVAGVGLLGIILTAKIQLRRVETSYFRQQAIVVGDLQELLAALDQQDRDHAYSVATLDVFASKRRLGKGVLTVGDHAKLEELPAGLARAPLKTSGPPKLNVPFTLPEFTLNRLTMRVLNSTIQGMQRHASNFGHYEKFFYPLDMIGSWNRGYGRRGFTQYQFVVPGEDGERRLRPILDAILSSGQLPFLNILKRLGKENEAPLSFPREGLTFAIDFPVRRCTIELLHRLDAMVADAGGRVYLAKDSYLEAPMLRRMYPRLDEWLEVKAKYDPRGVFTSDLGRRLGLV